MVTDLNADYARSLHGAAAVNALGLKHSTIFAGGGALCSDLLAYHYIRKALLFPVGRLAACLLMPAFLNDVRIHDLRHSFASVAAGTGMSLPMIGKLLGHTQPVTTARYAHLAVDPIRAASNVIGAEIDAAMNNQKPARKRIPIPRGPAVQRAKRSRAGLR